MRKLLISLLLASAAASPALAGPRDWSDRQQSSDNQQPTRQERQQAREQARADRSAERPSFTAPARMQPQAQQFVQRQQFNGGERFQQQQVDMSALRAQRDARLQQMRQQRDVRMQEIQQQRDLRQSTRPMPNVIRDRHPLVVSDTPRFGTQPPLRAESHVHWNTNWRNDGRHDWRRFRDHHRSRFHLGFFIDPFGWGYQPFDIGYRLWPAYYGNQYWLDAGYYGLPYPPPGAIWVRYFNDALLVDTYSGTVIDVIPGFFW